MNFLGNTDNAIESLLKLGTSVLNNMQDMFNVIIKTFISRDLLSEYTLPC